MPQAHQMKAHEAEGRTVEHIAAEIARRISTAPDGESSSAPLRDPEGLQALLESWPKETLSAALGTVVVLADVAQRHSKQSLSEALMNIATAALPRLQALLAAGLVTAEFVSQDTVAATLMR